VDPFELGARAGILPEADAAPVAAHVAAADAAAGKRLPFEAVWRSVTRHLMDVSTGEFAFGLRFFGDKFAREMFSLTLSRAINALLGGLEEFLLTTGDAPGLLLLIALTAAHRRIMNVERRCAELDGFFDRVSMLLWPKVKLLLDAHTASLKAAREGGKKLLAVGAGAAGGGAAGAAPASELGPAPLTRRIAELVAAFFVLHRQLAAAHLSDEMLPLHLRTLQREADGVIGKMAAELPSRPARLVFLVANYAHCAATAAARGVAPEDAAAWERAAAAHVDVYTEGELETHFKSLWALVKKTEAAAAAAAGAPPPADGAPPATILTLPASAPVAVDGAEVAAVLRDFNDHWRAGVRALNDDVLRYFSPSPADAAKPAGAAAAALAASLLRKVMTAFVSLYERFTTILTRALPAGSPMLREIVTQQVLFMELRKFAGQQG
jgi:hypothetical protein